MIVAYVFLVLVLTFVQCTLTFRLHKLALRFFRPMPRTSPCLRMLSLRPLQRMSGMGSSLWHTCSSTDACMCSGWIASQVQILLLCSERVVRPRYVASWRYDCLLASSVSMTYALQSLHSNISTMHDAPSITLKDVERALVKVIVPHEVFLAKQLTLIRHVLRSSRRSPSAISPAISALLAKSEAPTFRLHPRT